MLGVEDNGLEQPAQTQGILESLGDAAQNAAHWPRTFDELTDLWAVLDDAARADLLAVARGLTKPTGESARSKENANQAQSELG